MSAAYNVVAAERNEIEAIAVNCESCDSSIVLNIQKARVPESCASCGQHYSDNTKNALVAFGRFHREAKAAEEKAGKPLFRFEIKSSHT